MSKMLMKYFVIAQESASLQTVLAVKKINHAGRNVTAQK